MSRTKTNLIRIAESFTIRKIDPKQIGLKYFKGEYDERKLPKYKVKTSTSLKNSRKEIGIDYSSEIYRFLDRSSNNQIILTTNHSLYKYSQEEGERPILHCKYCKRLVSKTPIGLPIKMEREDDKVVFSVLDSFCDFGCCFSFLKRRVSENRAYKGSLYMNAEQILYCMYYRMHPDKMGTSILEKPDWDLLKENGGPLTDEEFDSDNVSYVSLPSIVVLPSKKQYVKHNFKKEKN